MVGSSDLLFYDRQVVFSILHKRGLLYQRLFSFPTKFFFPIALTQSIISFLAFITIIIIIIIIIIRELTSDEDGSGHRLTRERD